MYAPIIIIEKYFKKAYLNVYTVFQVNEIYNNALSMPMCSWQKR